MKTIKIMLLSLLVLGVVGGAMAFKAKFNSAYCITPARNNIGTMVCTASFTFVLKCPYHIPNLTTIPAQPFNAWCTTPMPASGCNATLNCVNQVQSLGGDN